MDTVSFRCPRCRGALLATEGTLTCSACGSGFPVREGIYDFRCQRHDYYFNPVPRDAMRELVARAPEVEWDETLRGFLRQVRSVPDWLDNLAVNGRYAWKLFLELPPDGRFLDFGCGLGNLTRNVAAHVGQVVALDLTWERLLFAQQRFAKQNPGDHITLVAGGDSATLPFPDAHFDTIALSGVLEWIAADPHLNERRGNRIAAALRLFMTVFGETNPRRTQLRFLQELRRILKPQGQLFVAIENRWGYEYFLGRPDHHSSLQYGSLLPRFVSNAYSIASRRKPYRTYTYGLGALGRLFAQAGFRERETLGLTPGYSGLEEILPADTRQAFWRPSPSPDLRTRVKRSRRFVPALGMIGSAEPLNTPLVGRLLERVRADVAVNDRIVVHRCVISGKDKVVLQAAAGGMRVVIKIPVDPRAEAGELNAFEATTALSTHPVLADLVPTPLTQGEYQRVRYFVERAVPGDPLDAVWDGWTRWDAVRTVMDLLLRLHPVVAPTTSVAVGSPAFETLVRRPLSRLRAAGLEERTCASVEEALGEALRKRPWVVGLSHGDFSRHNVFVREGTVSGIIDWEYASPTGLPALDAIAFLESVQRVVDHRVNRRSNVGDNLLALARWSWASNEELDLLRTVYRYFAIAPEAHPLLCWLRWLQHVGHQLDTKRRLDPRFMSTTVVPILSEWRNRGREAF